MKASLAAAASQTSQEMPSRDDIKKEEVVPDNNQSGLPVGWTDRQNTVLVNEPIKEALQKSSDLHIKDALGSVRASPNVNAASNDTAFALFAGWDQAFVGRWLEMVGLEAYVSVFSAQHIDGKALASLYGISLSDKRHFYDMLRLDLQIGPLGHRLRLEWELKKLLQTTKLSS